jgi:isoleucyl-tRNA synthetase
MDEKGQKMSKSLGNVVAPQDVMKEYGADILRLWVGACDYWEDQRIGKEILKTTAETYRKLRNTLRWMLGTLAHHQPGDTVDIADMPELERLMLHRLYEVDQIVTKAYAEFDYKRVLSTLLNFMTGDLSSFYFDIRKDALYCEPISSVKRKASLTVVDLLFRHVTVWLAPILSFTTEEAWRSRDPAAASVHLEVFPAIPASWRDDALAARWALVRDARSVVTGALEIERAAKRIGSSLEAAPVVHVADAALRAALEAVDFAEVCITSGVTITDASAPDEAFRLSEVPGVAVMPALAVGQKCQRSWRITTDVGSDPAYPDVSARDAAAMREWEAARA